VRHSSGTVVGFFIEQRHKILQDVFRLPFFAEMIEPANSLAIEKSREACVLDQAASFFDDADSKSAPYRLQLSFRSCEESPVPKIGAVTLCV